MEGLFGVKAAFTLPSERRPAPPPQAAKPSVNKGGLEVVWHKRLDAGLYDAVPMTDGLPLLAAATADGAVVFMDGTSGNVTARWDEGEDDPPNVMAFASQWLIHCSDACVRAISVTGEKAHTHTVAEEPEEPGKRVRVAPIDHAAVLADGDVYVAAAGRLVHAVQVPEGTLEHSLQLDAPIRAMCAAPAAAGGSSSSAAEAEWAYAIACPDAVKLVSRAGETVRALQSRMIVRSLAACGPWLAAATMEGALDLWDLKSSIPNPRCTLNAYCGSDVQHGSASIGWKADGGGLAISGRRAAVFDFTGANPPHPYRKKGVPPANPGEPDRVPRVCMADGNALRVAWASSYADDAPMTTTATGGVGASAQLATVSAEGVVSLWQPHGGPLRKGGNGNPQQPQLMKPQFYTFARHDAAHPSGEAVKVCSLMWLPGETVAVGYVTGEVVAWRTAVAIQ